ncbi:RdRP-domain-containing protein [Teratosphaeria nubilosa]|uniref:RNA-dependent RNA polymerase n=1 Tax=Teratosphaeria nubilosa TaxID=161662 RepID=A0A6G1LLZ1_9PEZI|nr:RdRP-domain-containing protein [Teratosphaeria nubilosa]
MRNGHVFSDGVGKISPFLARIIAHEHNSHHTDNDFPSVFQFRMAGCKGVVAVDPELKGKVIQYRDSQKKFDANDFSLGICRVSKFAGAHLNIQLIAVLEALGVQPWPFVEKMTQNVKLLTDAMTDEQVALQQLYKKVDGNGTALILADMIYDGFMSARDPFFYSCLRLWRAWWIKYLKEKAKIPIDDGAFVLGCIDETATLKGHFDGIHSAINILRDPASLPEIFLQIDDPDYPRATGRYKVITGICMVARNPSLHAGDIRMVRAVDVAALHHLKNCVVFPQTGDRPVPNMCSGGDLDGDDYLVMWDPDIMPPPGEWNHEAMDYTGPKAKEVDGEVTVNDIISFFVTHMKNENLGQIAVAHRFWADRRAEGVKSEECIALANLHSMAVDYAKTGVPAIFPEELRFKGPKPHWSEKLPCYRSNKAIGQLYNAVRLVDFHPEWEMPFDARILDSYCPDEQLLEEVLEIKQQYDAAIRRLMAQYGIRNEFEVWTTYVLAHNQDNDYKFAEDIAEKVNCVKQHFQELCCEKAGTTYQQRDWSKMTPFIAAMYIATARKVGEARKAKQETRLVGGQFLRTKMTPENMPFMSFPWLFPKELGLIAKKQGGLIRPCAHVNAPRRILPNRSNADLLGPDFELEELPEVVVSKNAFPGVEMESQDETVLNQPGLSSLSRQSIIGVDMVKENVSSQSSSVTVAADISHPGLGGHQPDRQLSHPVRHESSHIHHNGDPHNRFSTERDAQAHAGLVDRDTDLAEQIETDDNGVGGEEVVILGPQKQSALDALEKLMSSS